MRRSWIVSIYYDRPLDPENEFRFLGRDQPLDTLSPIVAKRLNQAFYARSHRPVFFFQGDRSIKYPNTVVAFERVGRHTGFRKRSRTILLALNPVIQLSPVD